MPFAAAVEHTKEKGGLARRLTLVVDVPPGKKWAGSLLSGSNGPLPEFRLGCEEIADRQSLHAGIEKSHGTRVIPKSGADLIS